MGTVYFFQLEIVNCPHLTLSPFNPGFVEFHLLRGPEAADHRLYASHTVWQSREHFEDWTRSEAFRKAHAQAGGARKDIYQGAPKFEGFEAVQTVTREG